MPDYDGDALDTAERQLLAAPLGTDALRHTPRAATRRLSQVLAEASLAPEAFRDPTHVALWRAYGEMAAVGEVPTVDGVLRTLCAIENRTAAPRTPDERRLDRAYVRDLLELRLADDTLDDTLGEAARVVAAAALLREVP
jgi:hypothetical protein